MIVSSVLRKLVLQREAPLKKSLRRNQVEIRLIVLVIYQKHEEVAVPHLRRSSVIAAFRTFFNGRNKVVLLKLLFVWVYVIPSQQRNGLENFATSSKLQIRNSLLSHDVFPWKNSYLGHAPVSLDFGGGRASSAVARLGSGQPAHPSSTPSGSEFRVFSPGELPV
jgi:hypothetical protein